MIWEVLFLFIFAGFVVLLDRDIDPYPAPLIRSVKPSREISIVFSLWGLALVVNALRLLVLEPYLQLVNLPPVIREWVILPLITLPFLILPLYISKKIDLYPVSELGLTWKSHSMGVTIFAIAFGVISGAVAFWTGETVVGITSLSAGALLLLLYNNAFLEEFFYRGVIQNRLERVFGQRWAILVSGFLFASTHVLLDITVLSATGGLAAILYAFLMQLLGGWLLGLIFIKTRTLWPGIICHYLVNWLPSILSLIISR